MILLDFCRVDMEKLCDVFGVIEVFFFLYRISHPKCVKTFFNIFEIVGNGKF